MKIFLLIFISLNLYSQEELSVITYNTALGREEKDKRQEEIIKELKVLDADILCLQEIFEPEKFIEALGYPYSFFKNFSQSYFKKGVCSIGEIFKKNNPFYCRFKKCSNLIDEALLLCLKENCEDSLNNLKSGKKDCAEAFISQVSKHPLVDMFRLVNPFIAIPRFLENGSTGLLLLSKTPLKNKEVGDFSQISSVRNRGALVADIEKFRVICAQISGPLESPLYMGSYSSWEEENKIHFEKLKKWIKGKNDILLGNLNCSKPVPYTDIRENYSKNCERIEILGLEEPIYKAPECTYCPYNNLVKNKELGGLILDNVFIYPNTLVGVDVIMKNWMETDSFLSDHFGIRVILKKNPREEE